MIQKTKEEKFEDFHRTNPHVYTKLVSMAKRAKDRGHPKFGIRVMWEALRWERMMAVHDPNQTEWKLNDHYTRFYARLIMSQEKDLAGIFSLRGDDAD